MARDLPVRLGRTRFYDHVVKLQKGEFRIFKKISGLEEMREAVEVHHEEVYQLYDVAGGEQGRSSYVAREQQQMLLFALYYVRETMYLGKPGSTRCATPPTSAQSCSRSAPWRGTSRSASVAPGSTTTS